MTLHEAIRKHSPIQAASLLKHMNACGLNDWGDLTKARLMDLRDHLKDSLAPASARTLCASLLAVLNRFSEEGCIPFAGFAEVLRVKGEKPVKTYLTSAEISSLEQVETSGAIEEFVLNEFLLGVRTGARISDIREMTEENVQDGVLTYTSIKTGITASVPCSERTLERLRWLKANGRQMATAQYNTVLRRLCKRAGITSQVKVHKGGKDLTGEKWRFISSHSARISVATNLAIAGTPLSDIKNVMGHTSLAMSERYVCKHDVKLNDRAMAYFQK